MSNAEPCCKYTEHELADFATRHVEGYQPGIAHLSERNRMRINQHLFECHECRMAAERLREKFLAIPLIAGMRLRYEWMDRIPERLLGFVLQPN